MTRLSLVPFTLMSILGFGCSAHVDSSSEAIATGGAGQGQLVSNADADVAAAAGASSVEATQATANGIWRNTSVSVQITDTWGITWCPDGVCAHGATCYALSRDKMSAEQLKMLDALVLVKGTACYLCDGWEQHELSVVDQDGSKATYAGPNCDCAGGTTSEAMVSADFFSAFPLDGAEFCAQ